MQSSRTFDQHDHRIMGIAAERARAQIKALTSEDALRSRLPLLERPMSKDQRELLRALRIAKRQIESHYALWELRIENKRWVVRNEKKLVELLLAAQAGGVEKLREGKLMDAREIFDIIVDVYLIMLKNRLSDIRFPDSERKTRGVSYSFDADFPREKINTIIQDTVVLSRAWVVSDACEYIGLDVEGFEAFRINGTVAFNQTHWPGHAVQFLSSFGWLEDIRPIRAIENNCYETAMEGYCSLARKSIVVRIPAIVYAAEKPIMPELNISPDIFAKHLSVLLKVLGLDMVLTLLPNFAELCGISANPVDEGNEITDTRALFREKLDVTLNFNWSYDIERNPIPDAYNFLKGARIIEEIGPHKARLTEFGKEIVSGINQAAARISVGFDSNAYPPYSVTVAEPNLGQRVMRIEQRHLLE